MNMHEDSKIKNERLADANLSFFIKKEIRLESIKLIYFLFLFLITYLVEPMCRIASRTI